MASPSQVAAEEAAGRDHAFHQLRIGEVVAETADANSFVLDVPPELRGAYAYEAGQFVTFRVTIDGETHLRCYSMSSAPAVDAEMKVTVKRVPGGAVSNWMIDTLETGAVVEATCPSGVFCLGPGTGDVVAFGAGSGITPVIAIVKAALATTERRVHLLYANRDRDSIIFATELDELAARYGERLRIVHHLDAERGFVDAEAVTGFAPIADDAEYFVCGPGPFMDIVEHALRARGVERDTIHIERFSAPAPEIAAPYASADATITVELDGQTETAEHHPGTTILQMARQMGLRAPSSCEAGSCATCMGKVVEGTVTMRTNNALTPEEVEEGWILTCQSVPTSPTVKVVYGYD
jgi:3-ketosteroid 9alpha-monooxygenase subunit B